MVLEEIQKRRSIRTYDPTRKVSREQITELCEAGMLAPSACSLYPVEYVIITDARQIEQIIKIHPYVSALKTAGTAIVVVADTSKTNAVARGMYIADCGAATENILLQATKMGLGTCWFGIWPNEKLVENFRSVLGLPRNIEPFCCIAVGTPLEQFGSRGKFDEKKIRWM